MPVGAPICRRVGAGTGQGRAVLGWGTRRGPSPAAKDMDSRPNLGGNFFFPTLNTLSAFSVSQSLCTVFFFSPPPTRVCPTFQSRRGASFLLCIHLWKRQ